ncbi:MAG: DUF4388 domain-containing protein [Vicinamibacteria bacterium]|nr:DUF4388 domain-containing protein [Vicinamibacteria bacterium]
MPPSDILQWIAAGVKTGTLALQRSSIKKAISFRAGKIYSSWSNDPRESLGQFLIRDQRINEEQLFKALLAQQSQKRQLGAILVAEGVLRSDDLAAVIQAKAEETIYDLFLWTDGQFEFKEGDLPQKFDVHLDLPVTGVIMEGIRRVDEWARIKEHFPTPKTTFKLTGVVADLVDSLERRVLGFVAAGKSLAEIGLELRRSEFETAAVLFELFKRGLIATRHVELAPVEADIVGAIQGLLMLAQEHIQQRRYGAAEHAYQRVLELDRLNQHAKLGLLQVADAQRCDQAIAHIALTAVPELTQDLIALTHQDFEPQEGFVLSRVNGQWDVQSILKLCPLAEDDVLRIFARLIERQVIRWKK